jgi:uncharacterized protein (DUF1778 family)
MLKRDVQGKFALKSDDYRQVRSLRLTDETWKALGMAAECLGMSRSDYLEQLMRENASPSITRKKDIYSSLPSKMSERTVQIKKDSYCAVFATTLGCVV